MYKIPKRVFEAIQVVAEHFGGIGRGREFVTDPITQESVPFCWWGMAKYAIDVEHLVENESAEDFRGTAFPSEAVNDESLEGTGVGLTETRMPFDEYCKLLNIVCVPD